MATWKDVLTYLKSNYPINAEDKDWVRLTFETENLRTQMVLVARAEASDGTQWLQIGSPVGVLAEKDLFGALTDAQEYVCGGLIKIENLIFVRHSAPLAELSIDELEIPMRIVTLAADALEAKYLGTDDN